MRADRSSAASRFSTTSLGQEEKRWSALKIARKIDSIFLRTHTTRPLCAFRQSSGSVFCDFPEPKETPVESAQTDCVLLNSLFLCNFRFRSNGRQRHPQIGARHLPATHRDQHHGLGW